MCSSLVAIIPTQVPSQNKHQVQKSAVFSPGTKDSCVHYSGSFHCTASQVFRRFITGDLPGEIATNFPQEETPALLRDC